MGNYVAYIWLALLIILAVVEAMTLSLTSIWFAGGALVAMIVAALGWPEWIQIMLFIAVSVVLLIFTRPLVVDKLGVGRHKTNVDAMIGETGVVTVAIHNTDGVGQIKIKGQIWSARGEEEEEIEIGATVGIVKIAGVHAYVKRV